MKRIPAWEIDGMTIWSVLDFYAEHAEKSDDLAERMVAVYLREKQRGLVDDSQ